MLRLHLRMGRRLVLLMDRGSLTYRGLSLLAHRGRSLARRRLGLLMDRWRGLAYRRLRLLMDRWRSLAQRRLGLRVDCRRSRVHRGLGLPTYRRKILRRRGRMGLRNRIPIRRLRWASLGLRALGKGRSRTGMHGWSYRMDLFRIDRLDLNASRRRVLASDPCA